MMPKFRENLFHAIESHDAKEVDRLLSAGADPDAAHETWPHSRPLHDAIGEMMEGGPLDTVKSLLAHGADADARDDRDLTALIIAVDQSEKSVIPLLLAAGADPDVRCNEGDTPIRLAVEGGDIGIARLLIDAGIHATINTWGAPAAGRTPLGLAAQRLDLPMIGLLLGAGADVEATDDDYKKARHRLPERTAENADDWDKAAKLLTNT